MLYNGYYPHYYNPPYGAPTPSSMPQYNYNNTQPYNAQQNSTNQNNTTLNNNTSTNKIYVNGIEDVKNRVMPFNSDFIFLDNDKPLLYRKVMDNTGRMEVQVFDIAPHIEEAKQEPAPIDTSKFVLQEDFEALKSELERLKSMAQQTTRQQQQSAPKVPNNKPSEVRQHEQRYDK